MIYTTEKTMKDLEGKVDKAKMDPLKKHVDELKELMKPEKKDIEALKKRQAFDKLSPCLKLSTWLYFGSFFLSFLNSCHASNRPNMNGPVIFNIIICILQITKTVTVHGFWVQKFRVGRRTEPFIYYMKSKWQGGGVTPPCQIFSVSVLGPA